MPEEHAAQFKDELRMRQAGESGRSGLHRIPHMLTLCRLAGDDDPDVLYNERKEPSNTEPESFVSEDESEHSVCM